MNNTITDFLGDGAYNSHERYHKIESQNRCVTVPPPENAAFSKKYPESPMQRDNLVEYMNQHGRSAWEIINPTLSTQICEPLDLCLME